MTRNCSLASLCLALFTRAAFGYGFAGHEVVGNYAEHFLKGTRAETEVRALLHNGETLARVSTWADRAKFDDKYLSPEMKTYVARNPEHHSYHYCDIPFQETSYHEGGAGTGPHDIVQTMKKCIAALLQKSEAKESDELTPRVALMVLVHLVGDIHQPLHVGCSYVNEKDQFVDPDKGEKGQEDAGANNFKLPSKTALHGFWDTLAVKMVKDKAPGQDFAGYLLAHDPPKPDWKTTGPVDTWPEKWATDTLHLVKPFYDDLKIANRRTVPADEKHPTHDEWDVLLPGGYEQKAADVVEVELAKAGYRLAEMLKAIWPDTKTESEPSATPASSPK
jgi:hypothetical protein